MVLHPIILGLGALAAAVPVLIHLLLKRRRQPMAWGAMRLVMEAFRSTRRRRVEKWLLLAARVLLLLLAGLVLARPIVGRERTAGAGGARTLWVVVDDSLTSGALGADGRAELSGVLARVDLELAKLGPSDRAGVILASAPARTLVSPPSGDVAAVRGALGQLRPTDARADWSGALALVRTQVGSAGVGGAASGSANTVGATASPGLAPSGAAAQVLLASAWRAGSIVGPGGGPAGSTAGSDAGRFGGAGAGGGAGAVGGLEAALSAGALGDVLATPPAARTGRESNVAVASARALRALMLSGERDAGQVVSVELARSGELAGGELSGLVVREAGGEVVGRGEVVWSRGQASASVSVPLEAAAKAVAARAASAGGGGAGVLRVELDVGGGGPVTGTAGGSSRDLARISADDRVLLPLLRRDGVRVGLVEAVGAQSEASGGRLRASEWVRLALRPTEASPIDVTDVPPSSVERPVLAGLDVLWVLSPQVLDAPAWGRVARWVDDGGVLVLSPPTGVTSHLWWAQASAGLGLSWRMPSTASTAAAARPARVQSRVEARDAGGLPDLLTTLRGELEELAAPVAIGQWLSPDLSAPLSGLVGAATVAGGEAGAEPRVLMSVSPDETGGESLPLLVTARRRGSGDAAGAGLIVYLGVAPDLSWSDLPAKPLFVAMLQEIVRQGVGSARPSLSVVAGHRAGMPGVDQLRASSGGGLLQVSVKGGSAAGAGASAVDWPRTAGVYEGLEASGASRGDVVVNADSAAGDITPVDRARIERALLGDGAGKPGGLGGGTSGGESGLRVQWLDDAGGQGQGASGDSVKRVDTGAPIGAGPTLLALVLALAVFELALAWLTARPERAGRAVAAGRTGSSVGGRT